MTEVEMQAIAQTWTRADIVRMRDGFVVNPHHAEAGWPPGKALEHAFIRAF